MQPPGVKLENISHLVGYTTIRNTESRYLCVQDESCQDSSNGLISVLDLIGNKNNKNRKLAAEKSAASLDVILDDRDTFCILDHFHRDRVCFDLYLLQRIAEYEK